MKIEYQKNKLKKQLSNASEIKKAFGLNARKVACRLDEILSSPNLGVLNKIPAANCHALSGDRKGEWALNISGNYRLVFKIINNPVPITKDGLINTLLVTDICILEIVDYH